MAYVCSNMILSPSFPFQVSFSNKIKAVAKSLDFKDPILVQGMYIFKQPKVGGEGKETDKLKNNANTYHYNKITTYRQY